MVADYAIPSRPGSFDVWQHARLAWCAYGGMGGGTMNPIVQQMLLAQAAWMEMEASIKSVEAATIRGDVQAAEEARRKAHDYLDCHLDLKMTAHLIALKSGSGT
jgi:hypothetical protein